VLNLPWLHRVSISGGQIPRSLLRLLEEGIVARMSEYIHQSHNVSVLMYHLVCPAKYRRVVFDTSVDTVLKEVCLDIAKRYAIIFLEIGTDKDHVHFLIQSIPTYSPTKIVKTIKSITAREVFKSSCGQKTVMGRGSLVQRILYQYRRAPWQ
jgi:REP-associated tyrosine transposase